MTLQLSVIICTYNGKQRLSECLRAIAQQNHASNLGWELLVVDNASGDGTAEAARTYLASTNVAHNVLTEASPGKSNALRLGVQVARGRLIAIVDDDNILDPNWISSAVRFFNAHPRAGIVGGKVILHRSCVPPEQVRPYVGLLAITDHGDLEKSGVSPNGAGSVIRADLLRKIYFEIGTSLAGRVGSTLGGGEDHEVARLAEMLGWECWYSPALRLEHLLPANRLTLAHVQKIFVDTAADVPWLEVLEDMRRGGASRGQLYRRLTLSLKNLFRHYLKPAPPGLLSTNRLWRQFYRNRIQKILRILRSFNEVRQLQERILNAAASSDCGTSTQPGMEPKAVAS